MQAWWSVRVPLCANLIPHSPHSNGFSLDGQVRDSLHQMISHSIDRRRAERSGPTISSANGHIRSEPYKDDNKWVNNIKK